jgi:hypothetical protein
MDNVQNKGMFKKRSHLRRGSISVVYSPFWKHVLDYWRLRDESYVLFNTYEDMKRVSSHLLSSLTNSSATECYTDALRPSRHPILCLVLNT